MYKFKSPGREMRGCPRTRAQKRGMRYCIAHNPLLLQPLGHWFTFIYRKCEHLAVGSSEQGLTRSRGHPPFVVALSSLFVPLLYHTLGDLSRGFLHFFEQPRVKGFPSPRRKLACPYRTHSLPLPLTSLVYHRQHRKSSTFSKKFSVSTR